MFQWFKKKFKKDDVTDAQNIEHIEQTGINSSSDVHEAFDFREGSTTATADVKDFKWPATTDIMDPINADDLQEQSHATCHVNNCGDDRAPQPTIPHKKIIAPAKDELDTKGLEHTIVAKGEKSQSNGFLKRFAQGMKKTSQSLAYRMNTLFQGTELDDDFYDELEEILVTSDMGAATTMKVIDMLKDKVVERKVRDTRGAKELLKDVLFDVMQENIQDNMLHLEPSPAVLMLVGVNGVGKTTTAGKLAYQFQTEGKKVVVVAADTFRAAAIDQLKVWCDRAGVPIISQKEGADPAAVVFDGLEVSLRENADITIIDTAGRLHNRVNLMNELNKIRRIIEKKMPSCSLETILALDATTGQNALLQVEEFRKAADVTGVALNKLDGTAKGGVIIPIQHDYGIPVKIVGVGESLYDLQPFHPRLFIEELFSEKVE